MSSPLSVILTQNKLTGENFNDWKRNLLIVLNFEKHSFVLTQPRPPTPAIDAPDRNFVAIERWDNFNLSAMCYIRASMSNVLQKQHEEHQTARQKVGTSIKEHMMKVMAYLSEAQTNGAEIDFATQLVMVFQTLSKDFDLFQASYNLNRKEMSLTELMKELQAFDNIFKGSRSKVEVNMAEPSSPAPNPKRKKEKRKNKGNKPAVNAPASKKSTKTKKRKVDPKKVKYFHCGKK
ncbi:hypothetical protein TIFTF001_051834 [Ficus carica]|uniref:Uncharacterized protein n=1 Tax=Ficus carica TaxID=3494 RepID=A0AA87YQN0_FICCA|nr:hypothetical protein TIFTF001_050919 [Ficus carica]GMN71446.1 hypothetical protein TIFTF001_051834 [Ficus carica]